MALNTFKCNCLISLHFKGLRHHQLVTVKLNILLHTL